MGGRGVKPSLQANITRVKFISLDWLCKMAVYKYNLKRRRRRCDAFPCVLITHVDDGFKTGACWLRLGVYGSGCLVALQGTGDQRAGQCY